MPDISDTESEPEQIVKDEPEVLEKKPKRKYTKKAKEAPPPTEEAPKDPVEVEAPKKKRVYKKKEKVEPPPPAEKELVEEAYEPEPSPPKKKRELTDKQREALAAARAKRQASKPAPAPTPEPEPVAPVPTPVKKGRPKKAVTVEEPTTLVRVAAPRAKKVKATKTLPPAPTVPLPIFV